MTAEDFVRQTYPSAEMIDSIDCGETVFTLYEIFIPNPHRIGTKRILGWGLSPQKAWESSRYNMLCNMQRVLEM